VEDFKACQQIWAKWAVPLFILSILLTIAYLVLMVGVGVSSSGSTRSGGSPF